MNEDGRKFDWGPPKKSSDGLKDFVIYLLIIAVLGFGLWILLDTSVEKKTAVVRLSLSDDKQSSAILSTDEGKYEEALPVSFNEKLRNIPVASENKTKQPIQNPIQNPIQKPIKELFAVKKDSNNKSEPLVEIIYSDKPKFYVQLGAFADEASASEVFKFLEENDFAPVLKAPDKQFEIYRVLIGPFNSEADADYRAEKLNDLDLPCFVLEY